MIESKVHKRIVMLSIACLAIGACKVQPDTKKSAETTEIELDSSQQIARYVVDVLADTKGTLWFGTLEKGLGRYDGNTLKYFTETDGLPSNRVTQIVEDGKGGYWLSTGAGLSYFDGHTFTNYRTENALCSDTISGIMIDSKGVFWIGTWAGVCRFDGTVFRDFPLPLPNVSTPINPDTEGWITALMEDSKGNIWIGRDGYGACKYDGKSFTHFLKRDGLQSNNVQAIREDKDGNIWFGTRVAEKDHPDANKRSGAGGLAKFDGEKFTYFREIPGFNESDVYEIYIDRSDQLWVTTSTDGLYKYDGKAFERIDLLNPVMAVQEDAKGNVWLGCAGGLYCIGAHGLVNVTQSGPWN